MTIVTTYAQATIRLDTLPKVLILGAKQGRFEKKKKKERLTSNDAELNDESEVPPAAHI